MKRKGSALLIVLGVLSFLVVSAVAFSAFMRRSRLPSSYLRRSVASRQLAKAALSEAIDQIDRAIANNVHPGVPSGGENTWRNRVFFRGGSEQPLTTTAPTLTLEGLAYIPPPLVNEARYWSRKTPTAVWQSIPYDIGRYAYCALDVSDYFDVNRLVADYPRSSAANRRVTIAHLFEDVNHRSAPSGASEWDTFMEKFRKIDEDTLNIDFSSASKIPLVSLADFNLALDDKGGIGDMKSPFGEYIKRGNGSFYPANSQKELETYAQMTFVTDGWFPLPASRTTTGANGAKTATKVYDLSNPRYQPFAMSSLQKGASVKLSGAALSTGLNSADSESKNLWFNRLSGLGCAALADYLDADRVPISLAVPTTERVPMICGIQPKFGMSPSLAVERTEGKMTGKDGGALQEGQATTRDVEQKLTWKIKVGEFKKIFLGSQLRTLVAFPFLHEDENDKPCTLDGKFSLFFTSEGEIPFRTGNDADALHFDRPTLPNTELNAATGVMTVKLEGGRPSFNKNITQENQALWNGVLPLTEGQSIADRFAMAGNEFLSVTYQWKQTRQKTQSGFSEWKPSFETMRADPKGNGATIKAHTVLPALGGRGSKSVGVRDEDFSDEKLSANLTADPNWSKKVFLNAAVWLRVRDSDGKIVDMVPASISDDKVQNAINDPLVSVFARTGSQKLDGAAFPVLRFPVGVSFDFGINGMSELEGEGKPLSQPKPLLVGDPRYNHAPECWFQSSEAELSPEIWLNGNLTGDDGRDADIFMATSDAGYLQSVYELAFLPRFTDLRSYGPSQISGNYRMEEGWNGDQYAQSAGGALNGDRMWRTYDPIDMDEQAFEDLPFTSEGSGMKVNPYSDSTNVLMAAFANTPVDWRRASTNAMDGTTDYASMNVKEFNQKYAWNAYSSGGAFAWEDLEKIAGQFMGRVRANGSEDWKRVWNDLGWYDDEATSKRFLGCQLTGNTDALWDADRKFLYGFWRDCFDAKQQLFLIFVRAEPLLLGGGTADQLPPQLGARAVALVWRDPTRTNSGYPHRTRLLFYRPLD